MSAGPGEAQGAPPVHSVCSAEHAGWLSTPVRRLITNPSRILRGLAQPGDTAVDLGCGPGFFTLPLAEMVGETGSVIAVDLQAAMLEQVKKRAERKGLMARIRLHHCAADSLDLSGEAADFALAFWMVHEVPDGPRFLREVAAGVEPGGRLLLVEPRGHVSATAFDETVAAAGAAGFRPLRRPRIAFSRATLFVRESAAGS